MINASLQDFIKVAGDTNRITFGDVKRLRRMVLPGRADRHATRSRRCSSSTRPLRAAIRLDGWLVAAVVDFAVWGERPTGYVEGEAAAWLPGLCPVTAWRPRLPRMIAREIEREAEAVDEAIAGLATKRPPRSMPPPRRRRRGDTRTARISAGRSTGKRDRARDRKGGGARGRLTGRQGHLHTIG